MHRQFSPLQRILVRSCFCPYSNNIRKVTLLLTHFLCLNHPPLLSKVAARALTRESFTCAHGALHDGAIGSRIGEIAS